MKWQAILWPAAVLVVLCALAALADAWSAWTGLGPTDIHLESRFLPPMSPGHVLGTDELGRDVLVRLLYGARVSLTVGLISSGVAAILGTVLGLLAGYHGGWTDAALMRLTDALLALPALPVMILLGAADVFRAWGGALQVTVFLALFGWMTVARLARATALQLRDVEFVVAARALGASTGQILCRHLLPHALPAVMVATTLEVGSNILHEAALSFLGLGVRPPLPSWGNMLTHAQADLYSAPWLAVWPGIMLLCTVAAFHFLGDGLRDLLDPRGTDQGKAPTQPG